MLFAVFKDGFPPDTVLMIDNVENRIIDPIKMALRPLTEFRLALTFIQGTDFFLCRQGDKLHTKPLAVKQRRCFFRHRPGDGLGRQIKNPAVLSLSHGFNRRKQCPQRLSRPRRRLNENIFPLLNRPVHPVHHPLLADPVFKRK